MASGDVSLYDPGDRPTVTLVANANGNVATRGDGVQIAGENSEHTEAALVDTAGAGVATLVEEPEEFTGDDADYAAGDVVGEGAVLLRNTVDWWPDGGNAFAPGDQVVTAAGGALRAYDAAGGDTADMILGRVWTTLQRGEYTDGKAAVVRES